MSRIENIAQSPALLSRSGVTLPVDENSAETLAAHFVEGVTSGAGDVRLANSASVLRLDRRNEKTEIPKLDPDLSPVEARKNIPLCSVEEKAAWDKKVSLAKKLRDLIKIEWLESARVLEKYSKQKVTASAISDEIKNLEAKTRLTPVQTHSYYGLMFAKGLRDRNGEFAKDHFNVPRVEHEKFVKIASRIATDSEDAELIAAAHDEEILTLVECLCVRPDERKFPEKNVEGFFDNLPRVGTKAEDLIGVKEITIFKYMLLELEGCSNAFEIESLRGYVDKIDKYGFRNAIEKFEIPDLVNASFPGFTDMDNPVNGRNPIVRKWAMQIVKWAYFGKAERNKVRDLATYAAAWTLEHGFKLVDENGEWDVKKASELKWDVEIAKSEIGLAHITEYCPDTPNLIAFIDLGQKELVKSGVAKKELIGFEQGKQIPVWEIRHLSMREGEYGRRLYRIELAYKLQQAGLRSAFEVGENSVKFSFSKADFLAWCAALEKERQGFNDFLKTALPSANRSVGVGPRQGLTLFFGKELPSGFSARDMVAALPQDNFSLSLEYPDLKLLGKRDKKKKGETELVVAEVTRKGRITGGLAHTAVLETNGRASEVSDELGSSASSPFKEISFKTVARNLLAGEKAQVFCRLPFAIAVSHSAKTSLESVLIAEEISRKVSRHVVSDDDLRMVLRVINARFSAADYDTSPIVELLKIKTPIRELLLKPIRKNEREDSIIVHVDKCLNSLIYEITLELLKAKNEGLIAENHPVSLIKAGNANPIPIEKITAASIVRQRMFAAWRQVPKFLPDYGTELAVRILNFETTALRRKTFRLLAESTRLDLNTLLLDAINKTNKFIGVGHKLTTVDRFRSTVDYFSRVTTTPRTPEQELLIAYMCLGKPDGKEEFLTDISPGLAHDLGYSFHDQIKLAWRYIRHS